MRRINDAEKVLLLSAAVGRDVNSVHEVAVVSRVFFFLTLFQRSALRRTDCHVTLSVSVEGGEKSRAEPGVVSYKNSTLYYKLLKWS